jgi:hypothetical protein
VKCDEAKPECERCTSTGRKCDGYVTPKPKKATPKLKANVNELALERVVNWEQGDSAERRAIDYFRCHTAISVASYFDSDFVSVLQGSLKTMLTGSFVASGAALCWQYRKASPLSGTPWSQSAP